MVSVHTSYSLNTKLRAGHVEHLPWSEEMYLRLYNDGI